MLSVTTTWRSIDAENSVIRASNFEGHKPPFWICLNIRDIIKAWVKQNKYGFWKSIARGEKDRSQPVMSYLMDFILTYIWVLLKIKISLFWLLKIQVQSSASLDLWCRQHCRRACCSLWTIKSKKSRVTRSASSNHLSLRMLKKVLHPFFQVGIQKPLPLQWVLRPHLNEGLGAMIQSFGMSHP